jgi:hypothetical protein
MQPNNASISTKYKIAMTHSVKFAKLVANSENMEVIKTENWSF